MAAWQDWVVTTLPQQAVSRESVAGQPHAPGAPAFLKPLSLQQLDLAVTANLWLHCSQPQPEIDHIILTRAHEERPGNRLCCVCHDNNAQMWLLQPEGDTA